MAARKKNSRSYRAPENRVNVTLDANSTLFGCFPGKGFFLGKPAATVVIVLVCTGVAVYFYDPLWLFGVVATRFGR